MTERKGAQARLALLEDPRRPGVRCCSEDARSRLGAAEAGRLADDLSLLAHPVRLQLLDVLARSAGRVCVCDLEAAVPVKQPTVSHHLKLLRDAGLIEGTRRGLWVYYQVRPEAAAALRARLGQVLTALATE